MATFTLTEAKARFSEVVEKAMAGEEIIVTKMGEPAVKVTSYIEKKVKLPLLGLMKGKIQIHGSFDDPLPDDIARAFGMIE